MQGKHKMRGYFGAALCFLFLLPCFAYDGAHAAPYAGAYARDVAYAKITTKTKGVKKQIQKIQTRLLELGFYTKKINGAYDSATVKAVKSFLKAAGLTGNGTAATKTMQALLFSDNAPTAPAAYKKLKQYQKGAPVQKMQMRLAQLGYFTKSCGGYYCANTAKAVKSFLKAAGLSGNGTVASKTMQARLYSQSAPSKLSKPEASPEPTAGPSATAPPEEAVYPKLKYGDKGEDVLSMQKRLSELKYQNNKLTGTYDQNTVSAVKTFLVAVNLTGNGTCATKTMQKHLYAKDAPLNPNRAATPETPKTKPVKVPGVPQKPVVSNVISLDWFSSPAYFDRAKGRFSEGKTAVVVDVQSGYTFNVYRTGGKYHADVEPLTAFDTWQMHLAYNKKPWDYVRHPVWVVFDGVAVAASIYGIPHGDQHIAGNNFGGHFCMHFENSRTHTSNKVDPDHKKAIKTALETNISKVQSKINKQPNVS